jgi:hypothetical protein
MDGLCRKYTWLDKDSVRYGAREWQRRMFLAPDANPVVRQVKHIPTGLTLTAGDAAELMDVVQRCAKPETTNGQADSFLGVHLSHCNFGENSGVCKYGEDEICPALTEAWDWLGKAVDKSNRPAKETVAEVCGAGGAKKQTPEQKRDYDKWIAKYEAPSGVQMGDL